MFQFKFSLKYIPFKCVRHVHIFRLDCESPKSIYKNVKSSLNCAKSITFCLYENEVASEEHSARIQHTLMKKYQTALSDERHIFNLVNTFVNFSFFLSLLF